MKKFTAAILLICYSVALVRPIMPIVSDVVAHTFWRAQHMATVHFENGKYHVHYALQEISKNDAGSKKSSNIKTDETLDFHIIPCSEIASPEQPSVTFLPNTSGTPLPASLTKDAPPPEA